MLEKQEEQLKQHKEAQERARALVEREWVKMQESRCNKGYEKRAWWDKDGKYHYDYGADGEQCGDNEYNTGQVGDHMKFEKKPKLKNQQSENEFGL